MAVRVLLVLAVAAGGLFGGAGPARGAGPALYPDLRARPPSDLLFDTVAFEDGTTHHVLRFSVQIWNAGAGRLELEGDPAPDRGTAVYQNLYDAPVGGARVAHRFVGDDLVFHPSHYHYHFRGFAAYLLLREGADGVWQPTTKAGTKTSFCVEDTTRVRGTTASQYAGCGNELQGLSVGWGDIYGAFLPQQWVDLGTRPLADGRYMVRVTADPQNKLAESNDANNRNRTCLTVRQGAISVGPCR
jgi:hypothetical protein